MKKLILLVMLISSVASAQWTFRSGGSAFDGKYKTTVGKGKSNDFPYRNPTIVFNYFEKSDRFNLYIEGSGYWTESSNVYVQFIFDDDGIMFESISVSFDVNNDLVFLKEFYSPEMHEDALGMFALLDKMKKGRKLYVRIGSDYAKRDLVFSLHGATKGINYVKSHLK